MEGRNRDSYSIIHENPNVDRRILFQYIRYQEFLT